MEPLNINPIVDVGLRFNARDIQCCNNVTCCISRRSNANVIPVQTLDGEVEINSDTIFIFEKKLNGTELLRPKKRFEAVVNRDATYRNTIASYYSFLCKQYGPLIVKTCSIPRGFDFVKHYNKAKPLQLGDITVLKTGLEEFLPFKKTLHWLVDKIHEVSQYMWSNDFQLLTKENIEPQQQNSFFQSNSDPSILDTPVNKEIIKKNSQKIIFKNNQVEQTSQPEEKTKSCMLFLKIMHLRGLLDISEVPLLSHKLSGLYKNKNPVHLQNLAQKSRVGYLRDFEADKLIFATKLIHQIFEQYLPQFNTDPHFFPSTTQLNVMLHEIAHSKLTLDDSNDTLVDSLNLRMKGLTTTSKTQQKKTQNIQNTIDFEIQEINMNELSENEDN